VSFQQTPLDLVAGSGTAQSVVVFESFCSSQSSKAAAHDDDIEDPIFGF